MITIISGTNRKNSNSLKVSKTCDKILQEQGADSQICCLTELPDNFFSLIYEKDSPGYSQMIDTYITKADRLVVVLPEYQGSYPGVLKAFLDSIDPKLIAEKKACLIGVASGRGGGIRPQSHFTDVLHHLKVEVFSSQPKLSGIDRLVDDVFLQDPSAIDQLKTHFLKFSQF